MIDWTSNNAGTSQRLKCGQEGLLVKPSLRHTDSVFLFTRVYPAEPGRSTLYLSTSVLKYNL